VSFLPFVRPGLVPGVAEAAQAAARFWEPPLFHQLTTVPVDGQKGVCSPGFAAKLRLSSKEARPSASCRYPVSYTPYGEIKSPHKKLKGP